MWNEVRSSRVFPVIQLTVLTLLFSGIFLLLEVGSEVGIGVRVPHEISVFISFLLLPFIYLVHTASDNSIKPPVVDTRNWSSYSARVVFRSLGGLDRGFLEGLFIYFIFAGYVFLYYVNNNEFFTDYAKMGWEIPIFLFFIALNVMPVDFFTKRFIQAPLSVQYGPRIAIILQTLVWLAAHIPESLWLDDLMGTVGVWVFLGFTGLITGISYERTKNVSGMMAGHVVLNLFVVIMARM